MLSENMYKNMLLLVVILASAPVIEARNETLAVTAEICENETFEPICDEGFGANIKSADMGRMTLGRCIGLGAVDFDVTGCESDVTSELSELCSTNENCTFPFPVEIKSENCDKGSDQYLAVTYTCIEVSASPMIYVNKGAILVVSFVSALALALSF